MRETFKAEWPSSQAVVLQLTMPRTDAVLDWKETIVTSNRSSEAGFAMAGRKYIRSLVYIRGQFASMFICSLVYISVWFRVVIVI